MSASHRRWSRRRVARGILRRIRPMAAGRPVPLLIIRIVRRIAGGDNTLVPRSTAVDSSGLQPQALAAALSGVELGTWALGPASIQELVRVVQAVRPTLILEFGSGSSTVALAWAVRETGGSSERPTIVSIEQDSDQAERTRGLLTRAGLGAEAVVLVGPLTEQTIEGQRTTCYALPAGLEDALGGRLAELIVIDGPAGPPGVRFGTLPLARPFARAAATFLLDDALRDGELAIARRWAALPYVRVHGIRLIEKGLLTGIVRPA